MSEASESFSAAYAQGTGSEPGAAPGHDRAAIFRNPEPETALSADSPLITLYVVPNSS